MISNLVKDQVRAISQRVGTVVARTGLTPDGATILGLFINCGVALVLASGNVQVGGVLLLIAAPFDMLDGAIARATGKTSAFGAFLDSTLDRYSECILLFGLLWHIVHSPDPAQATRTLLCFAAVTGSLLVSYNRARAEALGFHNEVGLFARPERVVALGAFLIFGWLDPILWILAVVTHLTSVQRIVHVWRTDRANRNLPPPAELIRFPRLRPMRGARQHFSRK
jgi:CDP-diacylglycerol--glycerol-3-phosphate 3-phosphatidyltransferase